MQISHLTPSCRKDRMMGKKLPADNIRQCLAMLRDHAYNGALSMECEGQAGPMIEKSIA